MTKTNHRNNLKILLLDNRDSFVEILAEQFRRSGVKIDVIRPDAAAASDLQNYDALVISPGPGAPHEAVESRRMFVAAMSQNKSVLGVCLGHQLIAQYFGAKIVKDPVPSHGTTSAIVHNASGIFAGVVANSQVMRYHSLTVSPASVPHELEVTARSTDGAVMAIAHRNLPIQGVQFHPESILSEAGDLIIENWLAQLPL